MLVVFNPVAFDVDIVVTMLALCGIEIIARILIIYFFLCWVWLSVDATTFESLTKTMFSVASALMVTVTVDRNVCSKLNMCFLRPLVTHHTHTRFVFVFFGFRFVPDTLGARKPTGLSFLFSWWLCGLASWSWFKFPNVTRTTMHLPKLQPTFFKWVPPLVCWSMFLTCPFLPLTLSALTGVLFLGPINTWANWLQIININVSDLASVISTDSSGP